MTDVHVVILHPEPADRDRDAAPLTWAVADARRRLAEVHRVAFRSAGASSVTIHTGPPDGVPFGRRLRGLLPDLGPDDGLVVLGSGAGPLLSPADRRTLVGFAASGRPGLLTNNRYSADILAIAAAPEALLDLPDGLDPDNALPRWMAESAGLPVTDQRAAWRLGVDIDGPLDLVLLGGPWLVCLDADARRVVESRLAAVRTVAADPRAELLVAGRTSAATLSWLERATASRSRVLIEERGMRTRTSGQRPSASVLGIALDQLGPGAFGEILARLADGAIVDSRVLFAHHVGADEPAWPSAEDRYASDLLLPERIADPWLRALTAAAVEAPVSVVLGGHTLVGPGLRLALRAAPSRRGQSATAG
jgi:hypothetical protein